MGCFPPSDAGSNVVRNTVVLGLSLAASFIMLLVAGIVGGSWLPFINLGAIVLVPVAVIIADVMGAGGASVGVYEESKQAYANFGGCVFGAILASLCGLPLVLLHNGTLRPLAFGLWMGSTAVTALASGWYWVARLRKEY